MKTFLKIFTVAIYFYVAAVISTLLFDILKGLYNNQPVSSYYGADVNTETVVLVSVMLFAALTVLTIITSLAIKSKR